MPTSVRLVGPRAIRSPGRLPVKDGADCPSPFERPALDARHRGGRWRGVSPAVGHWRAQDFSGPAAQPARGARLLQHGDYRFNKSRDGGPC